MNSQIFRDDQDTLSFYGVPIAQYCGKGVLTLKDGQSWSCSFLAGQMNTGNVLLLCTFEAEFPYLNIRADKFEGTTQEGFDVSVVGGITETNYLPDLPEGQSGVWAAFLVREMLIQMEQGVQAQSIHFGVTNLDLGAASFPTGVFGQLSLNNRSGVTELLVRPIEGYEKTMRRVRTVKAIDVTCEIIGETGRTNTMQLKEMVNGLCYLLSVGRGTKIQYIYSDQFDKIDHLISRSHYSRVTKGYTPLPIIDPRSWTETKDFIESTYPEYSAKCGAYRLEQGVIDAYLDAKAEHDYLEMRAAKLAVALEKLRSVFSPVGDIVDEGEFESIIPAIQKSVGDTLGSAGVSKPYIDMICNKNKLLGLNRKSFGSVLRKLCKEIGLKTGNEINLVISCRNSLVHSGDFYCNTATEKQCGECRPLPSPVDEFFFLINFLDKVFLKLFTYTGKYLNWRSPVNPTSEQL